MKENNKNRGILGTQQVDSLAIYPSIQEHFPSVQLAYGDPEHWSRNEQDLFKARFPIQKLINKF